MNHFVMWSRKSYILTIVTKAEEVEHVLCMKQTVHCFIFQNVLSPRTET